MRREDRVADRDTTDEADEGHRLFLFQLDLREHAQRVFLAVAHGHFVLSGNLLLVRGGNEAELVLPAISDLSPSCFPQLLLQLLGNITVARE